MNFFMGRFGSMESARRATAVRWHISMDDGVRAALVRYLGGITAKRKRKAVDVSPDERVEVRDERPSLVPVQPRPNEPFSVIYYVLDGRAGKMTVPPNGLLIASKLRRNCLPANGDKNEGHVPRNYVNGTYGSNQCWIPSGVSLYPSNHLARLTKQAEVFNNWTALFGGKQCLFSKRFLRTFSQLRLHNIINCK